MKIKSPAKWLIKYASLSFAVISILMIGIIFKHGAAFGPVIAKVFVIAWMVVTVVGAILGVLFRFVKVFRGDHDIYNSAGMCIGLFIIITAVLMIIFPPLNSPREPANRASCANNLKQMYSAMNIYHSNFGNSVYYMPHQGQAFFTCLLGHPESHSNTYEQNAPFNDAGFRRIFCCPSSGDNPAKVKACGNMPDYLGPKKHTPAGTLSALDDSVPANTPIAADKKGNHRDGGNVLFFDGTMQFLRGVEYEKALKELE
jgi:hypothetical protein